jgi:hypothetical protein
MPGVSWLYSPVSQRPFRQALIGDALRPTHVHDRCLGLKVARMASQAKTAAVAYMPTAGYTTVTSRTSKTKPRLL